MRHLASSGPNTMKSIVFGTSNLKYEASGLFGWAVLDGLCRGSYQACFDQMTSVVEVCTLRYMRYIRDLGGFYANATNPDEEEKAL